MMDQLGYVASLALLILGFGFVIFWHELGHFLAAKWVGIKVEQFAVGFGQAILAWRKGVGVRVGTTKPDYDRRIADYVSAQGRGPLQSSADRSEVTGDQERRAAEALGLGETEYRLNWLPLGGYVKMLGQDDMRPNAVADDPRAFNKKSVGARMFVVSAGVIMNIILAAIGFMVVFLIGFEAPAAIVGSVVPGSPAADAVKMVDGRTVPAPLRVGDEVLLFDGKVQHDFTKITLNVALAEQGVPVPVQVRRVDGTVETVQVAPEREDPNSHGFLMIGIAPPKLLRGLDPSVTVNAELAEDSLIPAQYLAIKPGDVIVAVNGQPVGQDDYHVLDQALQGSAGEPVELTVRDAGGTERTELVEPVFERIFGDAPLNFAGLEPRTVVSLISPASPAAGKLMPGDVILSVTPAGGAAIQVPTIGALKDVLRVAGAKEQTVDVRVDRDGEVIELAGLNPNVEVEEGRYGLGIALQYEVDQPVVAGVMQRSPAAAAGVPVGGTVGAVNGQAVESWFGVKARLAEAEAGEPVTLTIRAPGDDEAAGAAEKQVELALTAETIADIAGYRYGHTLALADKLAVRETNNPAIAAWWGVTETRDFVLQFYLTLQRMFQGSVSYKNMMGPVGIFDAGTKFALKGTDWLIWFLCMISANLAVVNFLPIPIVDGGLFLFLIIEKIQGRPLSAKTQSIAQVVGLAVILSVFLLVTYQDIARLL